MPRLNELPEESQKERQTSITVQGSWTASTPGLILKNGVGLSCAILFFVFFSG
jgi:hypothetical protein